MFMVYINTKFNIPSSSGPLVIATEPIAKYTFHAAAILFFHILQNKYINQSCLFFNYVSSHITVVYFSITYQYTSLQKPED
jgi:hypothetical protein